MPHAALLAFYEPVLPDCANQFGPRFSGGSLEMIAETAFLTAVRGGLGPMVMGRPEAVDFLAPLRVGQALPARIIRRGSRSPTVEMVGQLAAHLGSDPHPLSQGRF